MLLLASWMILVARSLYLFMRLEWQQCLASLNILFLLSFLADMQGSLAMHVGCLSNL
jgi:hypothetical protein